MSEKRKTLIILTPGFAKDEADSVCIPIQQSFYSQKFPVVVLSHLQFSLVNPEASLPFH